MIPPSSVQAAVNGTRDGRHIPLISRPTIDVGSTLSQWSANDIFLR